MQRRVFFSFIITFFFLSFPSVRAEEIVVESRDLLLTLEKTVATDGEGIQVVSLVDRKSGHEFCGSPARPLFTLVLRPPGSGTEVDADRGWNSVFFERKGTTLHLNWKGFKKSVEAENLAVQMQIEADPDKDGIEISQKAQTGSDVVSILAIRQGQFAVKDFGPRTKLFLPRRSGIVRDNPCDGKGFQVQFAYPGYESPMPWFVVWNDGELRDGFRSRDNVGLYLGHHDPQGSRKRLECKALGKVDGYSWPDTISCYAVVHAENMAEPGNELNVGGRTVLRAVRNDWYDGAKIYRDWVRREAIWYPREKMDEHGRTDTPQWFKDQCVWAMYRVPPKEMVPAMKKMRDTFGVPAALHWYYWHVNTYDNDYPHFVARKGFGEAVTEMQKDDDIFVMPYFNGLIWDTRDRDLEDWLYTKNAKTGAVKSEDGSVPLHSYGSKESDGSNVRLAPMCPTTEVWQKKVRENALRLMNEYGTKAVYIDQVGAHTPELCFDRSHGHPLGGGHWWADGYREMLETIRRDLKKPDLSDHPLCDAVKERLEKNPNALSDRMITTECTGETCLSTIDGYLTWHHQLNDQVPAFAAVYGGSVQMFGRDFRAGKDYAARTQLGLTKTVSPEACRMKAAQQLCFGEQIGWFVPTIVDEADKFPFLRKLVRLRHQLRHYFYKGEMSRRPEFSLDMPTITADWDFYGAPPVTDSAVQTGCWKIVKDGRLESAVVFFANTSDESVLSRIRFDFAELGFERSGMEGSPEFGRMKIRRFGPEGVEKEFDADTVVQPIRFDGQDVFAWEIRPSK